LDYLNKKVREGIEAKFNQNITQFVTIQKEPNITEKEIQAFRELENNNHI
jgi:hypothetical protein